MKLFTRRRQILLFFFILASQLCYPQTYGLKDGINNSPFCGRCRQMIQDMPPEVLFGIDFEASGDIYFSMTNRDWFNKIFRLPSFGVSVDIISKERYNCNKNPDDKQGIIKGQMIKPVYKAELIKNMEDLQPGLVYVKIGNVPANLLNKELEGNLVILNGEMICYYTHFVNIDRSAWKLLPMGLFTDTLLQSSAPGNDNDFYTWSKKIELTIPFQKNKTTFNEADIKPLYDSLKLKDYSIRKIEIRAYSSVEGSEKANTVLMQGRANAIINGLKQYQQSMKRMNIIPAENWLEFFRDIENTKYSDLKGLSKAAIKQKLTDKRTAGELEPVLAKHRKTVITVYLEKSSSNNLSPADVVTSFDKTVEQKDISKASILQKELAEQVIDNKIPVDYLNKLEIPATKEYSALLNEKEVYRYLLKVTSEYEALQNLLALKKLDPSNGKINYNICALRFFIWQYGKDSTISQYLLKDIKALEKQGIDPSLVKRMIINYHILRCEEYSRQFKYDAKDSSLQFIRDTYKQLKLNDEDIYSIAKYFTFYTHNDWAEEIIDPRIDQINASEDLVFYYINLMFYHPTNYDEDKFNQAVLNAINLNNKRFCNFFNSIDKGGASMQLLEYEHLRALYCENCK